MSNGIKYMDIEAMRTFKAMQDQYNQDKFELKGAGGNSSSGAGVVIVDSYDKLPTNTPVGSLACVATGSLSNWVSLDSLPYATNDEIESENTRK